MLAFVVSDRVAAIIAAFSTRAARYEDPPVDRKISSPRRSLMIGSTMGLVVLSLGISVAAGPLFDLAERAAGDLIDTDNYVEAVMGR